MRFILFFITLTCGFVSSEELRSWFLSNGSSFKATYAGIKSGKVGLKSEGGKTGAFKVDDLSIVDRYYLLENHEVSLEDLEGGNIQSAEYEYTPKSSNFKKGEKFQVEGAGYKVQLATLVTPHFILFYHPDLKIAEMGVILEKIWHSHAFRTPGFQELFGEGRQVYFFLEEGEELDNLSKVKSAGGIRRKI